MIFQNAKIATMVGAQAYGLIAEGSLVVEDGVIAWVGGRDSVPKDFVGHETIDLRGALVTPGLIDCHTHLVHGGHRAIEFERRLKGASYEEIARAGGGIRFTVEATRKASVEDLVATALPRLDALIAEGLCTIEIKSGYGLDLETELNMLRAARALEAQRPVRVKTSFLGAHAVPKDSRADDYIKDVCIPALRRAHQEGLVDAVDGFCEKIAFDVDQISRVFETARELNLPVKLHAEQLSNHGGTQLAARFGALSVDHIEYTTEEDIRALAHSGTVAVLLPGAFYTLQEQQKPPLECLRRLGVPMALATDCNPGSSPLTSVLLTMNMGCTLFDFTPEDSLAAVTVNAARALGMPNLGTVAAGQRADLCVWAVDHPAELSYRIGFNPLIHRIFNGQIT